MSDDHWQARAVDWLTMPHPAPAPPQEVIDALTRDGFYIVQPVGKQRARRRARDARDALKLMQRRHAMQRSRWRKRLEAWVDADVATRSWEAEILRREGGHVLPHWSPIELVRREQIARARAMCYFKPRHKRSGLGWAW